MSKKSLRRLAKKNNVAFHIGDRVCKISGKPFKSMAQVNTVKALVQNPFTSRSALAFYEDDSVVDSYQCVIAATPPNLTNES